jgi:hypothetical protein
MLGRFLPDVGLALGIGIGSHRGFEQRSPGDAILKQFPPQGFQIDFQLPGGFAGQKLVDETRPVHRIGGIAECIAPVQGTLEKVRLAAHAELGMTVERDAQKGCPAASGAGDEYRRADVLPVLWGINRASRRRLWGPPFGAVEETSQRAALDSWSRPKGPSDTLSKCPGKVAPTLRL